MTVRLAATPSFGIRWILSKRILRKWYMKWLKRLGITILALPVILLLLLALYEVFGACINHMATKRQTDTLRRNLESEIPDVEMIGITSETGNTSGTGNHVDCLSVVTFSTEMKKPEIEACMSKYYPLLEEGGFTVKETEDGYYAIYVITSAPFADNMEGH